MGVDYTGHYGLGYQVVSNKLTDEQIEEYGDFKEYLRELTRETKYQVFSCGDDCYTGDNNDEFYVKLKEPFKNGNLDLTEKATKLKEFLDLHNIETVGEFDVVGGLEIW